MDDVRLVNLLFHVHWMAAKDPHLQGNPQVAIQHKRKHLSSLWRLLKDAEKL